MIVSKMPRTPYEFALHPICRGIIISLIAIFVATGVLFIRIDSTVFDFWQHLAAFRSLSLAPLHPPPLYFSEAYDVHLYTPYHVFWGTIMSLTGLDVWTISTFAALTNIALYFIGCRLVARSIIGEKRFDALVSLSLFFLWGTPIWWSGVYSFGQILLQAIYPSFFALSAAMIVISLYGEKGFRNIIWQIGFMVSIAAIFLSHAITASVLLIFIAAKTMTEQPLRFSKIASTATVSLGGIGLALLWPYYSVWNLMLSARAQPDFFGSFSVFYARPLTQIGPSYLGVLGILFFRKSRQIRFLTVAFLILMSIFIVNYFAHLSHIFSRYLIYITLTLQLLCVAAFVPLRQMPRGEPALAIFLLILVSGGFFQTWISVQNQHGAYRDIASHVPLGTHGAAKAFQDLTTFEHTLNNQPSLAVVPRDIAYPVAALTNLRLLSVRHYAPTMPNFEERAMDTDRFFDAAEPCDEKRKIVDRWHIDFVIAEQGNSTTQSVAHCGWNQVFKGSRFIVWRTVAASGPR